MRRGYQIVERNTEPATGSSPSRPQTAGRSFLRGEERPGGQKGRPFEALSRAKQGQVRKMAARWLHERRERPRAPLIRFDAIGVVFDAAGRLLALEHLEGAF